MLTPAQIQQAKAASAPPSAAVTNSQVMTPEQAKASFNATPSQGSGGVMSALKSAGSQVAGQFNAGAQQFASAVDELRKPPEITAKLSSNPLDNAEAAAQVAGAGAHGVATLGKAVGGVGAAALSPLAPLFNAGTKVGTAIGEKTPDSIAKPFADTLQAHPEIGSQASDMLNMANLAMPEVASKIAPAVDATKNSIKEGLTPKPPAPHEVAAATAKATADNAMKAHDMIDKEVRNLADKYPSDIGKALNHAEITKGTEPIKVLASYPEGKALPTMNKGGKMNPIPAINFLKTQVKALGKIKGNLVDTAKQTMPIKDFQAAIESKIDASNGSLAKKASQKTDIGKIMDELKTSYPDGIPTAELDKIKSEQQAESSSYKTTGFPSRFNPDAHALVADVAKNTVAEHGGEAPINELNKWISSHHDAIAVLSKMGSKTPHGGMFSRHVGGIAGEVAGLAGGMALGHPFLGAMAGRGASEAVSNVLSSHFISNPLKRSIIDTMKGVDPTVIQKAKDFLNQDKESAPSNPTGTQENLSSQNPTTESAAPSADLAKAVDNHLTGAESETTPKSTEISTATPEPGPSGNSIIGKVKSALGGDLPNKQGGFVKVGNDTPKNVTPESVAKSIGGEDVPKIQNFVNNPNLTTFMELQPLLEQMKLQNLPWDKIKPFFEEVFSVRNSSSGGLVEGKATAKVVKPRGPYKKK